MSTSASEAPPARPLPALDETNTAFWTGGERGELRVSRCQDCRHWTHPPVPRCPACLGTSVAPEPASGRATLYTYSVNHHPWYPTMPVPYIVGIVELDEQPGLRLTTTIVGCDVDDVRVGMALQVRFVALEDVWLPFFERSDGA